MTKTVDVPIPMVGSLSLVAPSSFTNVRSQQANIAGDGKGGTKLSFTMTLFPPIGSTTAVFGYTADVKDGVVPRAEISALPVNPLDSPTFKTAADSYQGGADTGAELTDGAGQIDTNLLKLRDGAGDLLAGLIKLRDGADQLNAGLAGEAAPGAAKLAAGRRPARHRPRPAQLRRQAARRRHGSAGVRSRRAHAGPRSCGAGAGKLADGADTLRRHPAGGGRRQRAVRRHPAARRRREEAVGRRHDRRRVHEADRRRAGRPAVGSAAARGRREGSADVVAEPAGDEPAVPGLLGALKSISDGIGTTADAPTAGTILGGLNGIQYGMRYPGTTDCSTANPTKCGAADAVDYIKNQFAAVLAGGAADTGSLANLKATIQSIKGTPDCGPVCQATTDAIAAGIEAALRGQLTTARDGLARVSGGIDQNLLGPIVSGDPTKGALNQLRAGLSRGDSQQCLAQANSCGIKQGADFLRFYGVPALVDGIGASVRDSLLAGISAPRVAACRRARRSSVRCHAAGHRQHVAGRRHGRPGRGCR